MSFNYNLINQVKQAMHKLAAPPAEVTEGKPYVTPRELNPEQPQVGVNPDTGISYELEQILKGNPFNNATGYGPEQSAAYKNYTDYKDKTFKNVTQLPKYKIQPGQAGFSRHSIPETAAQTLGAPLAMQIPGVAPLINSTINGRTTEDFWNWQKPYTGNVVADAYQAALNSRRNVELPRQKYINSVEENINRSKELTQLTDLYSKVFPDLTPESRTGLYDQARDMRNKVNELSNQGRARFGLTPEQDFSATPEAAAFYEKNVQPLISNMRATENVANSPANRDVVLADLNVKDPYARTLESSLNNYGALDSYEKAKIYRQQGYDALNTLNKAPVKQIGQAAQAVTRPITNYLTPSQPVVASSLPSRLGQTAASVLKAFPYANRGYGGFYPRVDPNKPATRPNIPYTPASHMDAGAPMVDRRFSRMELNAAKPAPPVQQPAPKPVTPNLPAVPNTPPQVKRIGGGRAY